MMMTRGKAAARSGFMLLELTISLAILATILVIVAQTSLWSFKERWRSRCRHTAQELAANLMEAARAQPWHAIPAWAARHKLPKEYETSLPEGRLVVRLDDDQAYRPARKVTVEVHWRVDRNIPESVQLVGIIGPRASVLSGGKP